MRWFTSSQPRPGAAEGERGKTSTRRIVGWGAGLGGRNRREGWRDVDRGRVIIQKHVFYGNFKCYRISMWNN